MNELAQLNLGAARAKTGLDLVSGDRIAFDGSTYAKREKQTQSKVHARAQEEGVKLFRSLGYQIYPYAVGVRNVFTLADFLAIRGKRVVFVECLSDTNLSPETIERKRQLQEFGELCFIAMTGSKFADSDEPTKAKERIASEFDLIFFHVNPYHGDRVVGHTYQTIAWATTKAKGIKARYLLETSRRHCLLTLQIVTRILTNPFRTVISYPVLEPRREFERIYLSCFKALVIDQDGQFKRRLPRDEIHFRDMHRKTGVKAVTHEAELSLAVGYGGMDGTAFQPIDLLPEGREEEQANLTAIF